MSQSIESKKESHPVATEASVSAIEALLVRRLRLRAANAMGAVVFGIPLCFAAPLVLGTIFWFAAGSLLDRWYPWSSLFLILAIISIPLLFWAELRTGGDYLGDVARNPGPDIAGADVASVAADLRFGSPAGLVVSTIARPRITSAGLTELFLTGPRMLLGGLRHLKMARVFRSVDQRRAARLVFKLRASTQGMLLNELRMPNEPGENLVPVVSWLAYFGWVGVSEKRDRVFLFSETRDTLKGLKL